jgi:hypothetical protein
VGFRGFVGVFERDSGAEAVAGEACGLGHEFVKRTSGAKAPELLGRVMARLKPCPFRGGFGLHGRCGVFEIALGAKALGITRKVMAPEKTAADGSH